VFAQLDEYEKNGMIHISEIAPGRIRNIRDYVVEGKKVVCKVLRVNQERGYIDLSLRRVNELQKKTKLEFIKQEQRAERILEFVTKKLNLNLAEAYTAVMAKIEKDYEMLYLFFEDVVEGEVKLEDYIEPKMAKELQEVILLRLKPTRVELKGEIYLQTLAPNGIDIIKSSLQKATDISKEVEVRYKGSGKYFFNVSSSDYKNAEKLMEQASTAVIAFMEKNKGKAAFTRKE
jgi:translation initiation factor 2 subunit 1